MPVRLKNNARALLVVSITEIDQVIRVQVGKGDRFPTLGGEEWFPLILQDEQGNIEITHAYARVGDTITVRRGQEGTTARSYAPGALVSLRLTRQAANNWFTGNDTPDPGEGDPEYGGTGLIFDGLVAHAYHNDTGRGGRLHPSSGTSEDHFLLASAMYLGSRAVQDYLDDLDPDAPAMSVTGTLPPYVAEAAYEGRLQINNAVGICVVSQIGGDTLPPGSRIRVDNYTKQVVIDWPAYAELDGEPLPNGDFEMGTSDWILGPGWSVELVASEKQGFGGRVAKYVGQGESVMESEPYIDTAPGARFPIKVNVQQGASREGNCGAGIGVRFYNAGKQLVDEQFGNQVWSGSGGRWHWSDLQAVAPEGTAFRRAVILGGRKSQNKPLWVDDASWSVPEVIGTNDAEMEWRIRLLVTDTLGNEATWEGMIGEARIWRTSDLYPVIFFDEMQASEADLIRGMDMNVLFDRMSPSADFISATVEDLVKYTTYTMNDQFSAMGADLLSASIEQIAKYTTYSLNDQFGVASADLISASSAVTNIIHTIRPENFRSVAEFISGGTT